MAVTYGDVIYNPTDVWVAAVSTAGAYGTPVQIDYLNTLSFEFESDTDVIMSGGMEVENLAIPKNVKGTISYGAMNMAAMAIIVGAVQAQSETGTTPSRYTTQDILFGGAGLPYFGLVVSYAAKSGANLLVGFPKAILENVPGFTVEQNKFRIGETSFKAVAPSTTIRKAMRVRKFETADDVPQSASEFDNWFNGIWS